ncbi:fatty acyl-CoA reductase wat [Augochlora pura]
MAPDINESKNTTSSPELKIPSEESEIVEFYNGANVLVTGGTGFVGKVLVEKLLRSCPGIANLYIIVRPKKGKPATARFKENFDEAIYERLWKEQPDFLNKVQMIEGDATEEDLGMTLENKETLKNTNVVFHVAATVRFEEKLRLAVNINVRTVKQLLLWAKQLPNIKSFIYMSTAFSNCLHKTIDEIHYEPPIEADKLIQLVNCLNEAQLEAAAPILRGRCPNNYILTKAAAENAVLTYVDGLPVGIVRPSIIVPTYEEPIRAWINNLNGTTGVIAGSSMGLLRAMHCKSECKAEIIPADYVISATIAAGFDVGTRSRVEKSKEENISDEDKVPIYNSVTSARNPICWKEYHNLNTKYGLRTPPMKAVWYFMYFSTRYLLAYQICNIFLHIIPAIIGDAILHSLGHKSGLLRIYRKVDKFINVISFFSTNEWNFRDDNVLRVWERLNPVDQKIFRFNSENIDWEEYFFYHFRGIRVYLLKDPMENLSLALAKYNRLRIAHYSILTIIGLVILYIVQHFLLFLWPFVFV